MKPLVGDDVTRATVLIVEDEQPLADVYAEYLADDYDVLTAYGGDEAFEKLSDEVDVVLLDRRMPVVSGTEVLATIENAAYDCRVAMVTAVDPDFDIIDMGFDDYIVKPVDSAALHETVERLLKIDAYNDRYQQLTTKKLKRNVLEVEKSPTQLDDNGEFARLQSEIETLQDELEDIADDIGSEVLKRHL